MNLYPILSFEAEKLNMGSNISREGIHERNALKEDPGNHLGSSAKTPHGLQTYLDMSF